MISTFDLLEAARQGDSEALEKVVLENSGLIWSVARRYFNRGAEPDDLYQLGCIGFLKAVSGFDPEYGTQFSTYAVPKIAGEIRRFLRDDGAVKISRTIKERALSLRMAKEKLANELGRDPVLSELSEYTGVPVEEIAEAELANLPVESLQRENNTEGFTLENELGTPGHENQVVERLVLQGAIEKLNDRERQVILMRYYKNMTQDQTARVLGVSQVQISRLERRAIDNLRKNI
ncbi:MAG: sigma-70 family RNA polymerase sigma factor [Oscillospiraceae bacterium]|nr:sigma-70 family RNA polymerase sigma factor [Oscillospiraceae bacterium]